eukprot:48501-Eustigmatos_ZCMA.PRE.1
MRIDDRQTDKDQTMIKIWSAETYMDVGERPPPSPHQAQSYVYTHYYVPTYTRTESLNTRAQ